jgi:hypothetical protein
MSFWSKRCIKKCRAQSHSILACGPSHTLHKWKLTLSTAYLCDILRVHRTLGDHLEYTYCWGYIRLSIHWKLTSSGEYSCSSAYNAQFAGAILSSLSLDSLVCKNWAPPKCNFFCVTHHTKLGVDIRPFTKEGDEVQPRQCPCLRAFETWSACGIRRTRRRSDGAEKHRFYPGSAPVQGKDLRPACLTLLMGWLQWKCYSNGVDWI